LRCRRIRWSTRKIGLCSDAIPALFRIAVLKVILVVDAFSRMPLAFKATISEPPAAAVASVFLHAVRRHGAPAHLVTDQGSQFTATIFAEAVTAVGCQQRLGAVGEVGSVAIVERLWRTLKEQLRVRV